MSTYGSSIPCNSDTCQNSEKCQEARFVDKKNTKTLFCRKRHQKGNICKRTYSESKFLKCLLTETNPFVTLVLGSKSLKVVDNLISYQNARKVFFLNSHIF